MAGKLHFLSDSSGAQIPGVSWQSSSFLCILCLKVNSALIHYYSSSPLLSSLVTFAFTTWLKSLSFHNATSYGILFYRIIFSSPSIPQCSFFFFSLNRGLNSQPCTWQADTVPLSYIPGPILLLWSLKKMWAVRKKDSCYKAMFSLPKRCKWEWCDQQLHLRPRGGREGKRKQGLL